MKNIRWSARLLLSSSLIIIAILIGLSFSDMPGLIGYAAAADNDQPPVPTELPPAPPAPTRPQGPSPAPTSAIIPTTGPRNTPVPPTTFPEPPKPTPHRNKKDNDEPAFVTVVVHPEAGTTRQGDVVTLDIVMTNRGKGGAKNTRITMPLDPAKVTVLSFSAIGQETWVSQNTAEELEIQSGPLASNGDIVTGTLRLLLRADVPSDTPLTAALPFTWSDDADGGSGTSNAPVISSTPGQYALTLTPDAGAAGSRFTITSTLFAAREPVFVWYNGPDGIVSAKSAFEAGEDGSLTIEFDSTTLQPGDYSFVFYGSWTAFTAAAPFRIQ